MDRTELFTHLHILAGLQERDCRMSGLELNKAPEAVRAYAAAWLYGAGCALCSQSARHSDALAGLQGAEHWQSHQYVQPENSLYTAITANALI